MGRLRDGAQHYGLEDESPLAAARDGLISTHADAFQASLDRLRALGDGIFAFAMTVLVLDVRLPPGGAPLTGSSLTAALLALLPAIAACVLSFLVLCMYWIAHHNTFLAVARTNRPFVALSLLFLLCVAFVPFAAYLLPSAVDRWAGDSPDDASPRPAGSDIRASPARSKRRSSPSR